MKNTSIRDWAAIVEIIGTIAVIISLVFVVWSIDQKISNHVY
jgi:hypothetical protein